MQVLGWVGGLLIGFDGLFNSRLTELAILAARHSIPAIHSFREFALAGGLISYGPSIVESYQQVGIYVGRILNGERVADLPVIQAAKFRFVINLKTARAFNLDMPVSISAFADEIIE